VTTRWCREATGVHSLSGDAQSLVPAADRLRRLRDGSHALVFFDPGKKADLGLRACVANRSKNMDEDEDMDIDGLQRKVSVTLVGETV
jgi:hypothetical protein